MLSFKLKCFHKQYTTVSIESHQDKYLSAQTLSRNLICTFYLDTFIFHFGLFKIRKHYIYLFITVQNYYVVGIIKLYLIMFLHAY